MAVRPHVVVVGSGFGGLNAVARLASAAVDITVIDRDNYHGFWPLLYQVATAGLGSDDIARPIRSIYSRFSNVSVRLGTVSRVDMDAQNVTIEGETSLHYDFLVLAAGSATTDFDIPGVADNTFPLKTLPDAVSLWNHILSTFERADADDSDQGRAGDLTIVLAGGGATGVELAGALSELIAVNLASDFRHLDLTKAWVVLVEMNDHLLPGFAKPSSDRALSALQAKGVEVRLNTKLQKVTPDGVTFEDGTFIESKTVIWTAGVQANPLTRAVTGAGDDRGKGGTVPVLEDLSVAGHPNAFVIGDLAASPAAGHGDQLPQLAQVAIQGGKHCARNIRRIMAGQKTRPFRYHNHGIMATIGRRSAVAELPGGIRFGGTLGWLSWLGVHLVFLVGFRNRVVVLVNWAWNYLTWDRASRVILDDGSHTPTGQRRA